jgi:peroxiredoxin Q/BCP
VKVLGASPDDRNAQARFHAKHDLPFPLLCDTEQRLARAYGVWKERTTAGKTVTGIERSTFLVDGQGRIARAWRRVQVPGHAAEVLEAAGGLAG